MREFIKIPEDRLLFVVPGNYKFIGPMRLYRDRVEGSNGRGKTLPPTFQKWNEEGLVVDTDEVWEWETDKPVKKEKTENVKSDKTAPRASPKSKSDSTDTPDDKRAQDE